MKLEKIFSIIGTFFVLGIIIFRSSGYIFSYILPLNVIPLSFFSAPSYNSEKSSILSERDFFNFYRASANVESLTPPDLKGGQKNSDGLSNLGVIKTKNQENSDGLSNLNVIKKKSRKFQ